MREFLRTEEFDEYYNSQALRERTKVDYALAVISQIKVVSAKFVKKLGGTDFYELRVSAGNEHRILMFTIDSESFVEASKVLLLNGFVKKSTKDYRAQLAVAKKILEKYAV